MITDEVVTEQATDDGPFSGFWVYYSLDKISDLLLLWGASRLLHEAFSNLVLLYSVHLLITILFPLNCQSASDLMHDRWACLSPSHGWRVYEKKERTVWMSWICIPLDQCMLSCTGQPFWADYHCVVTGERCLWRSSCHLSLKRLGECLGIWGDLF